MGVAKRGSDRQNIEKAERLLFYIVEDFTLLENGRTRVHAGEIRIPLLLKQSKMFTSFVDSQQSGV